MDAKLSNSQFLRQFADSQINVNELDSATTTALTQAGIDPAELKKMAGSDGVIKGDAEIMKLFRLIDSIDDNGSSRSFTTAKETPEGAKPTPAGKVVEALAKERLETHSMAIDELVNSFSNGVLELSKLSDADYTELEELGVPQKTLQKLAGKDGKISGANSLRNLFRLLDHIDTNGSSYSFNLTSPIKTDADPKEALTPAGQAFEKLKTTFKPYDQAFTTYIDLSPARVDTTKKPITLAVKHQTQPNSVACFHTSYAMVKDYDGALAGKMVSYYDSFYMAKTESSTGAIAGWKGDFETGIAYIDKMLEDMRPVLVGVSHSDKDYNYDKKTDHFVVITGRGNDEEGRLFYTYDDPATSGKYKTAKLYVDQKSSMLFRPPLTKSGFFNNSYQVTQVRPYLDAPVDDQKEG